MSGAHHLSGVAKNSFLWCRKAGRGRQAPSSLPAAEAEGKLRACSHSPFAGPSFPPSLDPFPSSLCVSLSVELGAAMADVQHEDPVPEHLKEDVGGEVHSPSLYSSNVSPPLLWRKGSTSARRVYVLWT